MEEYDKKQCNTLLSIMIDSLKRKEAVLEELFQLTREQNSILTQEPVDMDEFNGIIGRKDEQLHVLEQLDQGFEQLFQKIKEAITGKKELYQDQILQMQSLIRKISDKSVQIEAMEQANQREFQLFVSQKRNQIKNFKVSSKTVTNYYKSMGGLQEENSSHMDKRK